MTKECMQCNSIFTPKDYRQKFCNHSCAATFNNKKFIKRTKIRDFINCLNCGEKLTCCQYKYCSRLCDASFKKNKNIAEWINGTVDGSNARGELRAALKRYLYEEAGRACTRCNWSEPNEILNYPILTIDHIDGNFRNNVRKNLVVLCYNCHTLTPTFGSLNKMSSGDRTIGTKNRGRK